MPVASGAMFRACFGVDPGGWSKRVGAPKASFPGSVEWKQDEEAFLTMVSEKLLDEAKLMLSTALGGLLE